MPARERTSKSALPFAAVTSALSVASHKGCRNLSPKFWRNLQVGDADAAVGSAVAALQVSADPPPRDRWVGIRTGVQDLLLHIGEDVFHRIVIGITFGQARPANPQGTQLPACAPTLDRMRRISIHRQVQLPVAVAAADLLDEVADIPGTLARIEAPQPPSRVVLVGHEQVEQPMRLLPAREHQPFLAVAAAAVGLDGDRLDIEKQQDSSPWPGLPQLPEPVEDTPAVGVLAPQLAGDAAESIPPFLSTRRRCSRLMRRTMR